MGNQCCNNLTSRIKDVNLNNDIINRMKQKYNNIKSDTIGYNCDYDEDNIDIFDKGIDCGTKKCINQNININSSSNNNDELENLDFNNFFSKSNDRNSITKLKIKNNKDKHSSNNKTEGDPYNINKLIHTKITSFNDTMTNFNNICSNLNCSIACKNNCKEIASYIDINKLSCIENIDYLIDITKDNYNFSNDITNNNITSNNNNNRNTNKTMYREAYKVKNLNLNSKLLSGFLSDSSSHSTNCFMSNLSKNTINNFKYNENCVHCAFNNTQFNNRNKKNKIEDKDTNDDNDNEMNFNANIDNEFIRKLIDNNSHSNNNHNNTSNYNDNITKYENFNKNLNKIKLNVVYKKKSSNQNSNNGNDDISNKYNYKNDKHSLYENRNFTHESITLDKYKERINNVNHLKGISNSNFINLSNSTNKNSYTLRRKRMYSNSVSFVNSHIMKTSNNKYNPNIMNNNNLYCIDSTREIINKFNKQNFIRHIINSNMNIAKECYSSNQRGINPYKANKLTKNYSYDNILIRDYKSYLCVEVINKENNKSDIKRIKSNKNNNSNIAITKPQFAYVITDKGEVFNISTDCDFLKNNYNNYVQDNDICFYDSFNSNFPVTIGSDKNSRIFINDTSENLNSLNYISVSFFKNQYIIKFLCCINMKVLDNVELNKKNTILFHCCKIDIEIEETKRANNNTFISEIGIILSLSSSNAKSNSNSNIDSNIDIKNNYKIINSDVNTKNNTSKLIEKSNNDLKKKNVESIVKPTDNTTNITKKFIFNSNSKQQISIGSSQKCDISIPQFTGISSIQCRLKYINKKWYILDGSDSKKSKNGTWISYKKNDYLQITNNKFLLLRLNQMHYHTQIQEQ